MISRNQKYAKELIYQAIVDKFGTLTALADVLGTSKENISNKVFCGTKRDRTADLLNAIQASNA